MWDIDEFYTYAKYLEPINSMTVNIDQLRAEIASQILQTWNVRIPVPSINLHIEDLQGNSITLRGRDSVHRILSSFRPGWFREQVLLFPPLLSWTLSVLPSALRLYRWLSGTVITRKYVVCFLLLERCGFLPCSFPFRSFLSFTGVSLAAFNMPKRDSQLADLLSPCLLRIPWRDIPMDPSTNYTGPSPACSTTSIFLHGIIYTWYLATLFQLPTTFQLGEYRQKTNTPPSSRSSQMARARLSFVSKRSTQTDMFGRKHWRPISSASTDTRDSHGQLMGAVSTIVELLERKVWITDTWGRFSRLTSQSTRIQPMQEHHRGLQPVNHPPPNRCLLPVSKFQPRFCSWRGFSSAWSTRTLTKMLSESVCWIPLLQAVSTTGMVRA